VTIAISPRFTAEKLANASFDDVVEIFEDRVMGWLIDPANHLKSQQHAGFAILAIVLSYFEPIGQALEGSRTRGGSRKLFSKGLRAVFPDLAAAESDALIGELYEQLRCGMFHDGLTREKVKISPTSAHAFIVEKSEDGSLKCVTVTPVNLMHHLEIHLSSYVAQLRDPANVELRHNFIKWIASNAN
jgi:hypothetical protein